MLSTRNPTGGLSPGKAHDTIAAIDAELGDNLVLPVIRDLAIWLSGDKSKNVCSIGNDAVSPEIQANILISNAVQAHFATGRYHRYRGVLSAVGTDMLSLWDHAIDRLETLDHYTNEQAMGVKNWMRQELDKIG